MIGLVNEDGLEIEHIAITTQCLACCVDLSIPSFPSDEDLSRWCGRDRVCHIVALIGLNLHMINPIHRGVLCPLLPRRTTAWESPSTS